MTYAEDIDIDKYNLDVELKRQAKLVRTYGEEWAEAVFQKDRQKNKLRLVEANVSLDIRENYKALGYDKKPTEDAIKALIEQDIRVQKERKAYDLCWKQVNNLITAKEAFSSKGKSLQILAELWRTNYWADPTKKINMEEMEQEKGNRALRKKLNENSRLTRRKNGQRK